MIKKKQKGEVIDGENDEKLDDQIQDQGYSQFSLLYDSTQELEEVILSVTIFTSPVITSVDYTLDENTQKLGTYLNDVTVSLKVYEDVYGEEDNKDYSMEIIASSLNDGISASSPPKSALTAVGDPAKSIKIAPFSVWETPGYYLTLKKG